METAKFVHDPVTTYNIEWIKRATGEELVKRFISVIQQANPDESLALLKTFFERAKTTDDKTVMCAYRAFTDEKRAEPHACVLFNFELKSGEWTQDIGQRVFEENYQRELAKLEGGKA